MKPIRSSATRRREANTMPIGKEDSDDSKVRVDSDDSEDSDDNEASTSEISISEISWAVSSEEDSDEEAEGRRALKAAKTSK